MTDEHPWPRPGDVLFTDDGNWLNACVGWSQEQWNLYIEGYRRGADVLVQHVIDTQSDQDFLIFPIVFLYRQAIEVALKRLLWKGNQILDRELVMPKHHRLVPLWQQCRPIIQEIWPDGPREDLDSVSDVLKQFEERDPISTAFRYPVTTSGETSLPNSEQINIRNFAEVANRVFALLDGCDCGFTERLEYKWEMDREYS